MPYVNNQGVHIHYETEGQGPPLVLQHGFTSALGGWKQYGYVAALKDQYRLVLVDARGHGLSDKPHASEAYTPERMASDITAVLNELHIPKANYFGYSMGGWIGYWLAKYAPERITAYVIGGSHPYRLDPSVADAYAGLRNGMETYVANMERLAGAVLPPERRAALLQNDPEALAAAMLSFRDRPSFEDVLPTMTVPCLLYAGTADPAHESVKRCAEALPNASFFSVPGLAHRPTFEASALVLPHVLPFLRSLQAVPAGR